VLSQCLLHSAYAASNLRRIATCTDKLHAILLKAQESLPFRVLELKMFQRHKKEVENKIAEYTIRFEQTQNELKKLNTDIAKLNLTILDCRSIAGFEADRSKLNKLIREAQAQSKLLEEQITHLDNELRKLYEEESKIVSALKEIELINKITLSGPDLEIHAEAESVEHGESKTTELEV